MDGFGGSSSSSALGLGNGPRPGAGGPSTNGGLLALDNAPAPAPAQTRTAVVYRGKTVAFLGEDKTSVKVGRTDDNDLTIRGTKGVTLELTWKDNIVAASVKQSTIPIYVIRKGQKDGQLLKHGHAYVDDADVRQTYGAGEGVETTLHIGDTVYFRDMNNDEHSLTIEELAEAFSKEEYIAMIMETRKQRKNFLEPRLTMLNQQIYNINRNLQQKVRPEEIQQEDRLKSEIKAIKIRIKQSRENFLATEDEERKAQFGELDMFVDRQEVFHHRLERKEQQILQATYQQDALQQPTLQDNPLQIAKTGTWEDPVKKAAAEEKARKELEEQQQKHQAEEQRKRDALDEELRLREEEGGYDDDYMDQIDGANAREGVAGASFGGPRRAAAAGKRGRAEMEGMSSVARANLDADAQDAEADAQYEVGDEEDDLLAD